MKSNRQNAIKECYFNSIVITGKKFNESLKEYNNFKQPLSKLCQKIANKEEPEFIQYLFEKYKNK